MERPKPDPQGILSILPAWNLNKELLKKRSSTNNKGPEI
jgi:hypothetical protein